jgi:hypothetical protein
MVRHVCFCMCLSWHAKQQRRDVLCACVVALSADNFDRFLGGLEIDLSQMTVTGSMNACVPATLILAGTSPLPGGGEATGPALAATAATSTSTTSVLEEDGTWHQLQYVRQGALRIRVRRVPITSPRLDAIVDIMSQLERSWFFEDISLFNISVEQVPACVSSLRWSFASACVA